MNLFRSLLISLWFLVLFAVVWFVHFQTEAINLDLQKQVVPALRELRQMDAEWNTDILRSRIGIHTSYDQITAPLRRLHEIQERLSQGLETAPAARQEAALQKLRSIFASKEELVEEFKSHNAVLRNSLDHFPSAVEELQSALRARGTVRPAQAGVLNALQVKAAALHTDIFRYHLTPEAGLNEKIRSVLDELEQEIDCCSPALRERLELLIAHARIIIEQRIAADALIRRITEAPTAAGIDDLSDAFDAQFQAMLNEKQRYRNYLVAYSLLLLFLLGYAARRLMQSHQAVARGNQRLQEANETLELRVAERTAELQRQAAQLSELATHDALTGLINRRELMVRLGQALQRAQRRNWVVVVLFIDIDGFKELNDAHGHANGDRVLKEVAARVRRHIRQEDAMARVGGDEFVMVLSEVVSRDGAVRVANAALEEIRGITEVSGRGLRLSGSIGISSIRAVGADCASIYPDLLLGRAEAAMYQAKRQGKNDYCFSEPAAWEGEMAGRPAATSN